MKSTFISLAIALLLQSCFTKNKELISLPKISFKSFGMSYRSGFERHFDIIVDSNHIFFSNQGYGIQYGILPDSIAALIDDAAIAAIKKTNNTYKITDCEDCPRIGITCIADTDTIKISQQGKEIETVFRKLFVPLYNLIRQKNNTVPINEMFFNTRKLYGNLPPPFPS